MCGVHQAVQEAVAAVECGHFGLEPDFHLFGCGQVGACTEDDALSFFEFHFEVARHEQVFGVAVASLRLLDVFHVAIPVGGIYKAEVGVCLHEEVGIAFVELHADAARHFTIAGVAHRVFVGPLSDASEGEEGSQTERCLRLGLDEGVANLYAEVVVGSLEDEFLAQHDASDAIGPGGHFVEGEVTDVFVPFGAHFSAFVAMQAQVEFCAMLHHGFVERGEEHVVLIVELGHGHYKQSVVFSDVASHECG